MTALTSPGTRARDRIVAIYQHFISGTWERGQTSHEVAEAFGCSIKTVENEASVLAHFMEVSIKLNTQRAEAIDQGLAGVIEQAQVIAQQLRDDPDTAKTAVSALQTIIKALDSRARNMGLQRPANEAQQPPPASDFDLRDALLGLTDDEVEVLADPEVWGAVSARVRAYRARTVETTGEVVESEA